MHAEMSLIRATVAALYNCFVLGGFFLFLSFRFLAMSLTISEAMQTI